MHRYPHLIVRDKYDNMAKEYRITRLILLVQEKIIHYYRIHKHYFTYFNK